MKYELPKKKLGKNFIIASVIAFPLVSSFYIVSINSNNLINSTMSFILLLLSAFFLVLLGFGIYFYKTGTDKITKRLKKGFRIALIILAAIYNLAGYTVVGLLYAPGSKFKDWLITTAMTTMSHQYFATWFYDDDVINSVSFWGYALETATYTLNLVFLRVLVNNLIVLTVNSLHKFLIDMMP